MKLLNIFLITIVTISFLLLSGCEPTDGKLELKEPKKELSEMPPGIVWDASDPDNARKATK